MKQWQKLRLTRQEILFLIVIAGAAIMLRLPAITFGLPVFEGADDAFVLRPALAFASSGQFAMQFGLPDATLFHGYGIVFRLVFEMLQLFGVTQGTTPLDDYSTYHATWPLITVRVINIMWSLFMLGLLYACARKLFSVRVAVIAVICATFSWMLIEHTLHARPDLLSAVLALGVLWVSMKISQRDVMRDYFLAGVLIGLAIATKYPLGLTAFIVIAAHAMRVLQTVRGQSAQRAFHREFHVLRAIVLSKQLWCTAGVALATFSFVTPLFWPNLSLVLEQFRYEARVEHAGADGLSFFGNLHFYLTHVLNYGIGSFVALFAIVGAVWCIQRSQRNAVLILVFPVALVLALSTHGLHWDRWLIPVLPFLALCAAVGIDAVSRHVRTRQSVLCAILTVLVLLPAIVRSVRTWQSMRYEETREIAHTWIEKNGLPSARVATEPYTPRLSKQFTQIQLPSLGVWNNEELTKKQVDYLISNVDQRERFLTHPNTFPVFIEYYHGHVKHADRVFTARIDPERSAELLVPISDWQIWKNITVLDVRRGSPIEIYAFSSAAKRWHASY